MKTEVNKEERKPFQGLGGYERRLLSEIYGLLPRIDGLSTHTEVKADGKEIEVYDVPEEKKGIILDELYPFSPAPCLEDVRYDLHEHRNFKVRDFMVIREDDSNFAVSPYYLKSGGTVLDWVEPVDEMMNNI